MANSEAAVIAAAKNWLAAMEECLRRSTVRGGECHVGQIAALDDLPRSESTSPNLKFSCAC